MVSEKSLIEILDLGGSFEGSEFVEVCGQSSCKDPLNTLDPRDGSLSLCVCKEMPLWESEILRLGLCVQTRVPEKNLIEVSDLGGSVWGHEFVDACGWS